jgi:hypothetical protein
MLNRLFVFVLMMVLLPVSWSMAETRGQGDTPESVSPVTAFRSYFDVPPFGTIVVPTIVSVPVEGLSFSRTDFAVLEVETNEYVKPAYITNAKTMSTPVTIIDEARGENLLALSDTDTRTTVQFNVTGDSVETTTLVLTHQEPIVSSALHLTLDRNVNVPDTVSVKAVVNGREQVVLANTRLGGTSVSFPPTTASVWYVTLTHRQLLRLSKVSLQNEAPEVAMSKQVRFLAQPDRTYRVYFDADRSVPVFGRESGTLTRGSSITTSPISPRLIMPNPEYQMVDRDDDGIPDARDNCPAVANSDQVDIDGSRVGDSCEDFDRDGVMNAIDNCVNVPNQDQRDEDGDDIGDACDDTESRLTEKYQFIPWAALGVALITILTMFVIVARRPIAIASQDTPEERQ